MDVVTRRTRGWAVVLVGVSATCLGLWAVSDVAGAEAARPSERAAAEAVPCQVVQTDVANKEITTGAADDSIAMNLTATGPVADVDIQVGITHPNDGEVSLTLFRLGHAITLVDSVGGTGDNFSDTVFDDEAAVAITSGTPPFAGSFRPMDPLSVLDTTAADGEWRMLAKDLSTGPGTLSYWRVIVTLASCDLDGDGVEDHVDSCLGRGARAEESGCPEVDRKLTLTYDDRFKGRIKSDAPACRRAQKVTVWKVAPGRDTKVGKDETDGKGRFAVPAPRRAGSYYATVPRSVVPDRAECAKSRSSRLTI